MTEPIRPVPDLVSVVMPIFNGAATLDVALEALAAQDFDGRWELVLVDNHSTDDTRARCLRWLPRFDRAVIVSAHTRQGVSYARNTGVLNSRGEFVAVCDADDAAETSWLRELVDGARHGDVVCGHLRRRNALNTGDAFPEFETEDVDAPLPVKLDYLPFASGANMGVWRDVFDIVDGWDESFFLGADDIDFSWRAQRAGYHLHWQPTAVIDYRLRVGNRAIVRQRFHYGRTDAQLAARYADVVAADELRVPVNVTVTRLVRLARSTAIGRTPPHQAASLMAYTVGRAVGQRRYADGR